MLCVFWIFEEKCCVNVLPFYRHSIGMVIILSVSSCSYMDFSTAGHNTIPKWKFCQELNPLPRGY